MNVIGTVALPHQGLRGAINGVARAVGEIDRHLQEKAKLTLAEYAVLDLLVQDPLCMSDLAGRLACQKSNMTQLIDRMQKKGLVVRKPHLYHSRMLMVYITPEGDRRWEAASRELDTLTRSALLTLSSYGVSV